MLYADDYVSYLMQFSHESVQNSVLDVISCNFHFSFFSCYFLST